MGAVEGEVGGDGEFFDKGQGADGVEAYVLAVAAGEEAGAVGGVGDGGE